jgi:hypothetical protein
LTAAASAAAGTSLIAAHRDHVHPITATASETANTLLKTNATGGLGLTHLVLSDYLKLGTGDEIQWYDEAPLKRAYLTYSAPDTVRTLSLVVGGTTFVDNTAELILAAKTYNTSLATSMLSSLSDTEGMSLNLSAKKSDTTKTLLQLVHSDNGTIFSVDRAGNTGFAGDLTLADAKKLLWSDVNLYRSAANVLKTDDSLDVVGDYKRDGTTGYIFVPYRATSTSWDGDQKYDANNGVIDLSAVFGLPAGIKAISATLQIACATVGKTVTLGASSAYRYQLVQETQVANNYISNTGLVTCDANGDVYFWTDAVTAAKAAVYLVIYGYYI